MLIEVHLPDQAVLVTLITGGTTVAVTLIKAASSVAVAWIQALRQPPSGQEPPPLQIEPPDP